MTVRLPSLETLTARRDDSVKNAEALYYAEGRGLSFNGPDAALSSALDMALERSYGTEGVSPTET